MFEATLNRAWKEIDRILWEVWDPIGVNDMPEARDGYQDYIADVYAALREGKSDDELGRMLRRIEADQMGLSCLNSERSRTTVAALRQIEL